MTQRPALALSYLEAVHVASFYKRLLAWDAAAIVRIQTRGQVAGFWADTPMNCLAFIAVPLAAEPAAPIDAAFAVARLRDIIGDVSHSNESNKLATYALPDEFPFTSALAELPPPGAWIQGERFTCSYVSDVVEAAIADFHRQSAAFPTADRKLLDQLATQIWQGPGIASFPLKGLHAARQLGFLTHANARADFATLNGWKRLVTPAGTVFSNTTPPRTKLRVV